MGIQALKELIAAVVEKEHYHLYSCDWVQDGKMKILQVAVMDDDGKMDLDTCAKLSGVIGDVLDDQADLDSEYYLEVCSPGAERELRSNEEIAQAFDKEEYVYIKLQNPKAGLSEVKGYIREMSDETIKVEYMAKNIKKSIDIELANISLIRLAVKI